MWRLLDLCGPRLLPRPRGLFRPPSLRWYWTLILSGAVFYAHSKSANFKTGPRQPGAAKYILENTSKIDLFKFVFIFCCCSSIDIPADFSKRRIYADFAFDRRGFIIKIRPWVPPKELRYNIPQCWSRFRTFNCVLVDRQKRCGHGRGRDGTSPKVLHLWRDSCDLYILKEFKAGRTILIVKDFKVGRIILIMKVSRSTPRRHSLIDGLGARRLDC